MYLFILFTITTYLYLLKKNNVSINILSLTPPFFIYFLAGGLQYNVGTDYFSYLEIYRTPWLQEKYFDSAEYIFYYANKILNFIELPEQSILLFFSFLQSIFFFIFIKKTNNEGMIAWVVFFIFFTTTNIYNNQLNGIRQYAALLIFPLLAYHLFYKHHVKSLLYFILAITLHQTAYIFLILLPLLYLYKNFNLNVFYLFILSIPIYIIAPQVIIELMTLLNLKYVSYLTTSFTQPRDILNILTKIYYIPLIIYFYVLYKKENSYFGFMIFLFSLFYFSFLMSYELGILSRISSYFWILIVFPLYYILSRTSNITLFFFMILYLFVPYLLKTTFFAKGEFIYNSIIFN